MAKSQKKSKKNRKQQTRNNSSATGWVFGGVVVIAVIILLFIFLGNNSNPGEEETVFDYENQPFMGEESAPVKIVEFGDYKCPVCKNFNESFVPQVKKELIETGKAKFYFINYPFINVDSTRSAKFAEAVYLELGDKTFWKFHDLLFEKQPEDPQYEKQDIFTKDFLIETLKEVADEGEVDKVVQTFESEKAEEQVAKDLAIVKELGVNSTPTVYINGKRFEGNTTQDFMDMVNEAAGEKE
ncbi:DsbA family protein [Pseudalkalibacillus caeni]|uniref:DsbA family protein n=1 Tax=Exobacillus caeni TaxID=2574798 RepID=A0A5R9F3F8_9BACL|nr:thioredoxin domain-containing protein [Pseudalkalibacillus caeni]TLS36866.1 DsbA family protein [Pseudalkalibacillus caeni]